LVEGRISTLLLEAVKPFLTQNRRRSIDRWGCGFVETLINITHKQWLFQNSKKHHKVADGLTVEQHERKAVLTSTRMAIESVESTTIGEWSGISA